MKIMKSYTKPTINIITLTMEERFAAGSMCTLTGGCGYPDSSGQFHEVLYWTGLNGN